MTIKPTPFKNLLARASRRLENFFHRCSNCESALFVDPGLDIVISRLVEPDIISNCFKKVFTYQTNRISFGYDKILIFSTGAQCHLKNYVDLLTATDKPPGEIIMVVADRFDYIARQFLEAYGFLHRIKPEELRLPAWILDPDLATIELPNSYIDQIMGESDTSVERLSKIITSFPIYDFFTNVFAIGPSSVRIAKSLSSNFYSAWTHMIIIDRTVDNLTPFLSSFTYESMVAEYIGIKYGIAMTPNEEHPILFSEKDTVSVQLRNLSYTEATEYNHILQRQIAEELEEMKNEKDLSLDKLRLKSKTVVTNQSIGDHLKFMEGINNIFSKDLNLQTNLRSEVDCILGLKNSNDFIRKAIALSPDWRTSIRLLAIYSLCTNKAVDTDEVCTMIIDRFGLEALAAIWSLDDAGIIGKNKKNFGTETLIKRLQMYNQEVTKKSEKPYDGFTPVAVKIVQKIAKNEWSDCKNVLEDCKIQTSVMANRERDMKKVLVVFVGGATYGEVAALRNLKYDLLVDIDVLTTELLTYKKAVDQLAGIDEQ